MAACSGWPTAPCCLGPVQLLFVSLGQDQPVLISPRNLAVLGAGARLDLVETHVTLGGGRALTNQPLRGRQGCRAEPRPSAGRRARRQPDRQDPLPRTAHARRPGRRDPRRRPTATRSRPSWRDPDRAWLQRAPPSAASASTSTTRSWSSMCSGGSTSDQFYKRACSTTRKPKRCSPAGSWSSPRRPDRPTPIRPTTICCCPADAETTPSPRARELRRRRQTPRTARPPGELDSVVRPSPSPLAVASECPGTARESPDLRVRRRGAGAVSSHALRGRSGAARAPAPRLPGGAELEGPRCELLRRSGPSGRSPFRRLSGCDRISRTCQHPIHGRPLALLDTPASAQKPRPW